MGENFITFRLRHFMCPYDPPIRLEKVWSHLGLAGAFCQCHSTALVIQLISTRGWVRTGIIRQTFRLKLAGPNQSIRVDFRSFFSVWADSGGLDPFQPGVSVRLVRANSVKEYVFFLMVINWYLFLSHNLDYRSFKQIMILTSI